MVPGNLEESVGEMARSCTCLAGSLGGVEWWNGGERKIGFKLPCAAETLIYHADYTAWRPMDREIHFASGSWTLAT
jgi:hypothetical protein